MTKPANEHQKTVDFLDDEIGRLQSSLDAALQRVQEVEAINAARFGQRLAESEECERALRSALTELLRLYDWRFELAKKEDEFNSSDLPEDEWYERRHKIDKLLREYGRQKKAAWEVARRLLEEKA